MNTKLNKKSFLYKSMLRGRTKLTIITALVLAIFICYTASIIPYLEKIAFGSVALDGDMYARDVKTVCVSKSYKPDKSTMKIYGYASRDESYWQGDKYFFSTVFDKIDSVGLAYTLGGARVNEFTDTEADPVAVRVDFVYINGVKTAVMYMGNEKILPGMKAEGVLVNISPLVLRDLADYVSEGEVLSEYMLDIRGIDMSTEFNDTVIWFFMIALIVFLLIRLGGYYINPLKHPTYKQLDKYGDTMAVIADINWQIDAGADRSYKNEVRTADWILTKRSFYYKAEKNFTANGTFKYTPYEK